MEANHPLHHGIEPAYGNQINTIQTKANAHLHWQDVGCFGVDGLSTYQQLWYEFHIECLLRKLNDMQSSGIPAQRDFLLQEFQRINQLNSPQPSSDPEPPLTMA